jgi:adenosylhomocysteinase
MVAKYPDSIQRSIVKDLALAPSGRNKIEWVSNNMPVLNMLKEEFTGNQPLAGKTLVCCLHLEAKTGYLLQTLQAAGAEVIACASNPLSTQDDVVAALVESVLPYMPSTAKPLKNMRII